MAVKHVVPRDVTWSNTIDTAEQIGRRQKEIRRCGTVGYHQEAGDRSER